MPHVFTPVASAPPLGIAFPSPSTTPCPVFSTPTTPNPKYAYVMSASIHTFLDSNASTKPRLSSTLFCEPSIDTPSYETRDLRKVQERLENNEKFEKGRNRLTKTQTHINVPRPSCSLPHTIPARAPSQPSQSTPQSTHAQLPYRSWKAIAPSW